VGPSAPEEAGLPDYLTPQVVVPATFGLALAVSAPLVWAGSLGVGGALLVLFYGGLLLLALGLVLAFLVGLFVLGVLSLAGVGWILLDRLVILAGPPFGVAAVVLAVVGLLLLPRPFARLREIARVRKAWNEQTGGSVPPAQSGGR
jgi:hypothetical protein